MSRREVLPANPTFHGPVVFCCTSCHMQNAAIIARWLTRPRGELSTTRSTKRSDGSVAFSPGLSDPRAQNYDDLYAGVQLVVADEVAPAHTDTPNRHCASCSKMRAPTLRSTTSVWSSMRATSSSRHLGRGMTMATQGSDRTGTARRPDHIYPGHCRLAAKRAEERFWPVC